MIQLDDDCIERIFSFITINIDMIHVSSVCKRFTLLMRTQINLKSRTIRIRPSADDEQIMYLVRGWNELQIVDCTYCTQITGKSVKLLSELPNLRSVNFSCCYQLT